MAVTAANSAIFWDMTPCNAIELPTSRRNVVPPSSRVKGPENGSVSMCLTKCTLKHRGGWWFYSVQVQLQWTYTNQSKYTLLCHRTSPYCGPGSSVSIATDYGLDGTGSNPGRVEIFRPFTPALGPTQPPVKWVPGLSRR